MSKKMNVLIACGGTGGHLFPGIAVAEMLVKRGHNVLLLISEKKIDAQASEKYGILEFKTVPAIAKPATLSLKMIPFMVRLWKSVRQCREILQKHECDVVLGMGGFTSLPPILAGKRMGLATYVHDSNALPGKANRLTARWCNKVLIGLEAASTYFKPNKVIVTGTPVRSELTGQLRQDRSRATFGLPSDGKAILVMGGSQGAQRLNTLITEAATILQKESTEDLTSQSSNEDTVARRKTHTIEAAQPMGSPVSEEASSRSSWRQLQNASSAKSKKAHKIQFLHITGASDFERVKKLTKDIAGYHVISFCDDMATAYSACDMAVCRAGASSMTELSYIGMPSILVPYPYAADDHQTFNANVFEKAGAAILRQEADLSAQSLVKDISSILEEDSVCQTMSQQAEALAVKDAAAQICNVITEAV